MKRLANPPPRPIVLWAVSVLVALHGVAAAVLFYYQVTEGGFAPRFFYVAVAPLVVAVGVVACQAVAVFRRHWMGSWMAASVVGVTFAVPGGFCFLSSPLAIYAMMRSPSPMIWSVAANGVWSALALATGTLMLWWAVRLYRWRVLKLRPRRVPVEDEP